MTDIQYITDAKGNPVGVIVPIEIWNEIESEQETAYPVGDMSDNEE